MDMTSELAKLNGERVEIKKLVRKTLKTGNLCYTAICTSGFDDDPDIWVELWFEHRKMLDKAGYNIDWTKREPVISKPIPIILKWNPEYRSLRMGEVAE